ncbi:PLP-dependent aminotransferase family protein [Lichenihabitans sp. Uapishka_5]|uniref:aminotransferase-like domain-containing protein n=1 Tax=Lichenihabitans sp. Uapishka_5 TaxID=3037302 RepID=UPI0029E7E4F6|nr:PLP-dependent aminotransferase family protein [Lichenihabitans sp. Uapishka_5]MDX7953043.1 PLP-dependent aminotransferase family protein [Lichenihabitans sp. Uapishka_5]
MQAIADRIASRALPPGARLPSVRKLAETMAVSKSTVVEAYERLGAEGAIQSRPGSGFFVSGATRPLSLKALGPKLDRVIDPVWLTYQAFNAGEGVLKPGSGWLPTEWMPDASIQKALRQIAREPIGPRTAYDEPQGFSPLRQHLARRLDERGIAGTPDQIIIMDSATQALDLLMRFLLEPGDTVVVDDPCYFNFHALLRAHRAEVVGVPYRDGGPDLEAFAAVLAAHRPRLYLTNSALQNPTGGCLSATTAHRVLKLAERHDTVIVEDDIFADFEHAPSPRLAGFDGLDRVVHIGGSSKMVSAAMRCSYIATKHDWIEPLVDLKLATTLGNNHLAAAFMHRVLTDGSYRRHAEGIRAKLSDAMGQTLRQLRRLGLKPSGTPQGGLSLWAELPTGLDAAAIARFGLRHDVLFAPGNVFSASGTAGSFMRFNVARSLDPRVFEVLQAAMRA